MTTLPIAYMRVVRETTGFFGTYTPDLSLAPGVIGRLVDGVFVKEGRLDQCKGFDAAKHAVERQPKSDSDSRWTSKRVTVTQLAAGVSVPGASTAARFQIKFGAANETAIFCHGTSHHHFANLAAVKALMGKLLEKDQWDKDQCLITEVLETTSARIFFASGKNQMAEFTADAPVSLPAATLDALQAILPKATLTVQSNNTQFAGYFAELPSGSTPLFMAIRFTPKGWLVGRKDKIDYLKGPDDAFEEPPFGENATRTL